MLPTQLEGRVRVGILIQFIIVGASDGGSIIMEDDFMDLAEFALNVFLSDRLFVSEFTVFGEG